MTVRLKLFLTCLGLAILPVVTLSWISSVYTQQTVIAQTKARLTELANFERSRLEILAQAGNLTPDRLNTIAGQYGSVGDTGESIIVKHGDNGVPVPVTSPRFGDLNTTLGAAGTIALQGTDTFVEDTVDYRGKHVFLAVAYVKSQGWGIEVKRDRDEVLGPYQTFFAGPLLIGLILIVLAAAFIAIIVTQSVIAPIQSLTSVTRAISFGNLQASIDPDMMAAKDEIGDLARAFDRTVISLKLAMIDKNQAEEKEERT